MNIMWERKLENVPHKLSSAKPIITQFMNRKLINPTYTKFISGNTNIYIYKLFLKFLNTCQRVTLEKIFFMSDKALLTIHSQSHGCDWPRAMIWAKAVLKIRTICHARDLWKLAQSCKQLHLLCPSYLWNLPGTSFLSGFQSSRGDELSCGQACDWQTHRQRHRHRQMQAMIIPKGQNWPRVKIMKVTVPGLHAKLAPSH